MIDRRAFTFAAPLAGLAFAAPVFAQAADPNLVYLDTKDGRVTIQLRPDLAPHHVAQIKTLVKQGFYNGLLFHRVIAGFMAQTGDPTGTGSGGSTLPDLKAEFTKTPFKRGTLGMARTSDPNSANSQFFICFGDASFLNGQYTVVGEVHLWNGRHRQDQERRPAERSGEQSGQNRPHAARKRCEIGDGHGRRGSNLDFGRGGTYVGFAGGGATRREPYPPHSAAAS